MTAGSRWPALTPHELVGEDKSRLVIGPFGSSLKVSDYRDAGVPLVFVRDIREADFRTPRHFVSPAKAEELRSHTVLPGDVLITKMGNPPGDSAIYTGRERAIITADCIRLRPLSAFDPTYIHYAIQAPAIKRQMERITSGVAQRKVSLARFRTGLSIPVPALNEQRRIVALLEDHLLRLDVGAMGLKTAGSRADTLLTAALWRATHDLPKSKIVKLQSIAEVRLGRQRSPKNHTGDRMRPYLRAANVDWDTLRLHNVKEMQFTEEEEKAYRLEQGDILLTEASGSPGEVGKSVIYRGDPTDVCFQNTLLRVRCHGADPEFVQKFLLAEARAGRLMPESRGVGINHLGRARLAEVEIGVPTPAQQAVAVETCRRLVEDVGRLQSFIEAQTRRSEALRRSVLDAAFSGRLTGSCLSEVEEMVGA